MDKKFLGLTSILFLAVFLLVASIASRGSLFRAFNPRAAQETLPSAERSLLFAWPQTISIQDQKPIKIDVFARSEKDKAIPDKPVVLSTTFGTVTAVNNVTDNAGHATFSLSATTPGVAKISASIESIKLNQEISVIFE